MGMKLSFCSSEPYNFSPERLPKEDSCHEKVSFIAWIVDNMKPICLWRKKRSPKQKTVRHQQRLKMANELTLGEWFLKSPTVEKDSNYNGEHYGFKHRSGSDYPSVAREGTYFSDSGGYSLSLEQLLNGGAYASVSTDYSLSSEKLLKDDKVHLKEMGFKSLARSQSGKEKKRVSFRLPEVSDIIILYPPEVDFKE